MERYHDTDYLAVSAALHARETRLLTKERAERMLDAPSAEDAWKVMVQLGYPEVDGASLQEVERALSAARRALYQELRTLAPDKRLVEFFELKYDYHNIKAILKSKKRGGDAQPLLMDCGRCDAQELLRGGMQNLSIVMRRAAAQAQEALDAGDAQGADLVLDRACFEEMAQLADETGSDFLKGYVALQIDAVNLRTLVRSERMGCESEFLTSALLPGGTIAAGRLAAARGTALTELLRGGALAPAAELAAALMANGGSLTEFERCCDNVLMDYLRTARNVPFGEKVVIGYLGAKEAEFTAVRTILSGKRAGLDADAIRARLRGTYL